MLRRIRAASAKRYDELYPHGDARSSSIKTIIPEGRTPIRSEVLEGQESIFEPTQQDLVLNSTIAAPGDTTVSSKINRCKRTRTDNDDESEENATRKQRAKIVKIHNTDPAHHYSVPSEYNAKPPANVSEQPSAAMPEGIGISYGSNNNRISTGHRLPSKTKACSQSPPGPCKNGTGGGPRKVPQITVAWCNVRKAQLRHSIILQRAYDLGVDVVHIQEPSCGKDTSTQDHPGYESYKPMDTWMGKADGPRVMSYVCKGHTLQTKQRHLNCRDVLCLEVNGYTMTNIYRQPRTDKIMDYVISLEPPKDCLVGGDFNARHPDFQPGTTIENRGDDLASWASSSNMEFTGIYGEATHNSGNVIDMVFSNIPLVESSVIQDLEVGSDHRALLTIIPGRGTEPLEKHRYRIAQRNLPCFAGLVRNGVATLPNVNVVRTEEQLEHCAVQFQEVFCAAIEGVSNPITTRERAEPWWSPVAKEALREYKQCPKDDKDRKDALWKRFRKVVRECKKEQKKKTLESANSVPKLCKILRGYKSSTRFKSPPLRVGDRLIDDTLEKAEAMSAEILEIFHSADDLIEDPLEGWQAEEGRLPWDTNLSLEETEHHTIGVTSTSPGLDGITIRLLKACWEIVRHYIRALYEKVLQLAYYPKVWKVAKVIMIPKSGQKDLSSPRSWRPISLLSCLGKGLERVCAARMAWTTLEYKVCSPQHIGALPKRSAVDLVASFTNDVEQAFAAGMKVTMVTADVKGAFNGLLRKRLIFRMREQGWNLKTLKLVNSFLSDRTFMVELEGIATEARRAKCGTPQGSPWSSILYMLYLAELFQQDTKLRFGYADNLCLYRASRSLEENTKLLAGDIESILGWADNNKVPFADEKWEMIHLTKAKQDGNPRIQVPGKLTIEPVPVVKDVSNKLMPALKWLGIWVDRKLTFRRHVIQRASSSMTVARQIRALANMQYGAPADALRKVVIACVTPTALYGTEVWYGGREKPAVNRSQAGKDLVDSRVGWHIDQLQRSLLTAARAVIPVWRTTPTSIIFRDAGLQTAQVALENARWRFAHKLNVVDDLHLLASRVLPPKILRGKGAGGRQCIKTKVQATAALLPDTRRPLIIPPRFTNRTNLDPTQGATKEEAAEAFREWLNTLSDRDIVIYSDGSQLELGKVGYGFAIYTRSHCEETGWGRLHPISEVFDAEAVGAWMGLQTAIAGRLDVNKGQVWVCLDSTNVIRSLDGNGSPSSQWAFRKFRQAMDLFDVKVKWCPSHCGIEGNERADQLAKAGAILPEQEAITGPSVFGIKSMAKRKSLETAQEWWKQEMGTVSDCYRRWDLEYTLDCPPELKVLTRSELHHFLSLRTGHGDFEDYHTRFGHKDATLRCSCGSSKAPEHLVHCRLARQSFDRWPKRPKTIPEGEDADAYFQELMQDPEAFKAFSKVTQFFRISSIRE